MMQERPAREFIQPGAKSWLKRLNILLRFEKDEPLKLSNGPWQKLLDDLHFAMFNEPRNRNDKEGAFYLAATPTGVSGAHQVWRKLLKEDDAPDELPLAAHTMQFYEDDQGLYHRYYTEDFLTMFAHALARILEGARFKKTDVRQCSQCEASFIPLRKPRDDKFAYCSKKCANLVAARNYRSKRKRVKKVKRKRVKKK